MFSLNADESKERHRSGQKELNKVRESLHAAQRELAAKAEKIAELEAQLKEEQTEAHESRKVENKEAKVPKMEKKPSKGKSPETESTKPTPPAMAISYDRNSAANFKGREEVLRWMRERIQKEGTFAVHIVGWANESTFPEVNEVIALNRARYLADYLKIKGIPDSSILSVSGRRSEPDDKKGRRCEISSAAEKTGKERKSGAK